MIRLAVRLMTPVVDLHVSLSNSRPEVCSTSLLLICAASFSIYSMIQQLSVCNFCVAKHLYSVIAKVTPFAAMKTLKLVFRALFIALFAAQLPHAYILRNGEHIWRPGMPAAEGSHVCEHISGMRRKGTQKVCPIASLSA